MKVRVGILTAPNIEHEKRANTSIIKNVRIGIGFHWDRYEEQEFEGDLEILHNADGTETAVNIIDLEDYLTSVISSEMSADSPMELLKAHAVISRSWVVSAIRQANTGHVGYDVCADDHCQRYEGILRRNPRAEEAVRATAGEVLVFGDNADICDTRYHKCCGGKTENFETCWEDKHIPYLTSVDCPYCAKAVGNERLLRLVLNNYDQETTDFYKWRVIYSQAELSDIICQKSGIDFGDILALNPLKRGASGRIYSLEIVGTKHTEVIGKELQIRQWLSRSCLYSSWFDVQYTWLRLSPISDSKEQPFLSTAVSEKAKRVPLGFVLYGHGWGHGVGLCQIGAAVMASEGFSYSQILLHYYRGATLAQL